VVLTLLIVWPFRGARRAYDTSKLYRDIKLRGSIIKDNQLIMLPDEHIFTHVRTIFIVPRLISEGRSELKCLRAGLWRVELVI